MTTRTPRDMTSFVDHCLDVFELGATASVADLGMSYRAWTRDMTISDADAVAKVRAALFTSKIVVVRYGGSRWVHGVQLTPVGLDMVNLGVVMHMVAGKRSGGASRRR